MTTLKASMSVAWSERHHTEADRKGRKNLSQEIWSADKKSEDECFGEKAIINALALEVARVLCYNSYVYINVGVLCFFRSKAPPHWYVKNFWKGLDKHAGMGDHF